MQRNRGTRFEIGDALRAGWQRFWPNILPMGLFALVVWAVNALIQFLQDETSGLVRFLFGLVGFLVTQLIAIGWIKIALDIIDGHRLRAEAVIDRFRLVVPYLLAALLFSLMVTIGLVLLIVPGIIVIVVFGFYGFHIVDTGDSNPISALRRSAEITRGHRLQLFLFGLVLLGINLLGILLLVIGVLITSGISLLAVAYAYRHLAGVSSPAEDVA